MDRMETRHNTGLGFLERHGPQPLVDDAIPKAIEPRRATGLLLDSRGSAETGHSLRPLLRRGQVLSNVVAGC
jgi:hypothetical protein